MSLPELTNENYYDPEIRSQYMNVHTYLDYVGSLGRMGCEARAEAMRKGEWQEETTLAMQVGSYVDSFFEGSLEQFKEDNPDLFATSDEIKDIDGLKERHPELFTRNGNLKAEWSLIKLRKTFPDEITTTYRLKAPYRQAEVMIERCLKDDYFMATMSGEKQVIFTADMFGTTWCCKLDSYIPDTAIVDLKTTTDLHRSWRVPDAGYVSVVEYWGYTTQLAVYQEIVRINTGKKLPCYLSFVTKEDSPEICVVNVDQQTLDHALESVRMNMPQVLAVRNGELEPLRCEQCDYCKATKKLKHAISMYDLISE